MFINWWQSSSTKNSLYPDKVILSLKEKWFSDTCCTWIDLENLMLKEKPVTKEIISSHTHTHTQPLLKFIIMITHPWNTVKTTELYICVNMCNCILRKLCKLSWWSSIKRNKGQVTWAQMVNEEAPSPHTSLGKKVENYLT